MLVCDVPRFQAHQPAPPSSSPPASECSFVTCHVSKLTNSLLPLPPLQEVSPRLCRATFSSSPPRSPSSSPPGSESSFVTCRVSKLTNPLLPLPPLQDVSSRLSYATFPTSPTGSSLFLPFSL